MKMIQAVSEKIRKGHIACKTLDFSKEITKKCYMAVNKKMTLKSSF